MNYYRFFKRFIFPHFPVYFLGILLLICVDALQLWVPKLIGAAIDDIFYGKARLGQYIWEIFWLGIAILICKYGYRYCILGEMRKVEFRLRKAIVHKAVLLPVHFFEKNGPGKIMALLINDVMSIRVAMGLGMLLLIDAIFLNGFAIWVMAQQISLRSSVMVLLPMPLVLIAAIILGRVVRKRFRRVQELFSQMTEYTQELFLGVRIIKSLVEEHSAETRFAEINNTNMQGNLALSRVQAMYFPLTKILPMTCYALSLYICGHMVLNGEITVGDFVAINGYIALLIGATMGIGGLISVMNKGLGSYDRLTEFFDKETEQEEVGGAAPHCPKKVDIEIRNLSYAYPGTNTVALHGVSMQIPAGSFIGLVGGPGSGKTTLFKLLMRLYNPPRGTVFFNGKDIMEMNLDTVRSLSAYVPQQQALFSQTVAENIAFPNKIDKKDLAEIEKIMMQTDISLSWKHKLQGKDQKLQEAGSDLSGGQQQRIGIARAIYKNSPIIILDDAVSALDYETASLIEKTIIQATKNKTVIFISQRIKSLRHADQIYVFKDGTIVEAGTHDELWHEGTAYYDLYRQQERGLYEESV